MAANAIPIFNDEQKSYFNLRLREELEAAGHKATHIATTPEEKAIDAHERGDLDALKDPQVRAAYLENFGVDEFGKLHLRVTRERREKQRLAEQQQLIERNKARQGRRVF